MNKKGEHVWIIIGACIAFGVLVILFIYLWGPAKEIVIDKLRIIIPNLNASRPLTEGIEQVRYNIPEDKVQYYDGTKWIDFKADIADLNDKRINKQQLLETYVTYYYDKKSRGVQTAPLSEKSGAELYPNYGIDYCLFFSDITRTNAGDDAHGAISIIILRGQAGGRCEENTNDVFGLFSFKTNGRLWFESVDAAGNFQQSVDITETKTNVYQEVVTKSIVWRNSVLKNPIEIAYFDLKTEQSINEKYCVDLKDNSYLVVDFKVPGENCDLT